MTIRIKNAHGLEGKVCVVTGAGSGIGRGIALTLAAEGAVVAILDRNEAGANETLRLVSQAGAKGLALVCDVSDPASVESACATIREQVGDAEVLVNNAAIVGPGALADTSLEDWNRLLSVNLTGYFICTKVFGRSMREKGHGAIVHISSLAAQVATPNIGSYGVAKAGVSMMSKVLAVEWGPSGVRNNAVHPGLIKTPLTQPMYDQPGFTERRSAIIPSRRIGAPEDVAEAVLFLASPYSSYINGIEVVVDGGFNLNLMNQVPRGNFAKSPD